MGRRFLYIDIHTLWECKCVAVVLHLIQMVTDHSDYNYNDAINLHNPLSPLKHHNSLRTPTLPLDCGSAELQAVQSDRGTRFTFKNLRCLSISAVVK
jgi:hypothetical protein